MEPPDELLDCARRETGLDDFGDGAFREGLDVLVRALRTEAFQLGIPEMPQFPVLYQGGARYRWDGEETYGMLERSSMRDKLTAP